VAAEGLNPAAAFSGPDSPQLSVNFAVLRPENLPNHMLLLEPKCSQVVRS
jgi:hypothetical protein